MPIDTEATDTLDVQIRLIPTLASARQVRPVKRRWILCPWLTRFPRDTGIWVSVLAAHDANGTLFDALLASGKSRPDVYAAVFAVDPFRSAEEIIHRIKQSGVGGVINFPTISFIDGAAGTTFEKLSLGIDRELEFLAGCSAAGLRVAGVVRTVAAAERLLEIGADFLVAHGGPPTSAARDPSIEAVRRIRNSVHSKQVPIVPLSVITHWKQSTIVSLPTSTSAEQRTPQRTIERIISCPASGKQLKRLARSTRRLAAVPRRGRFVLAAAIGTGMAARAAERGGADLLLALNAGRFRSMGAPSSACQLALRDSNRMVMEFGRSEILTQTSLPVFFGATTFGVDDCSSLVDWIAEAGFHGVANFPSCVFLDGQFRQFLEESRLGFDSEIALLRAAQARGLATLGYVHTIDEARRLASAGVDIVNIAFGWNMGGAVGVDSDLGLEDAATVAAEFVRAVRATNSEIRCVIEGGPIVTPEQMDYVCRIAKADGYVGGSTIDRVPLESAIEMATTAFRTVGALRKQVDALERQLDRRLAVDALIGSSEAMRRARDQVAHAMARSDLPVLILGEPGSGRSDVARAIHEAGVGRGRILVAASCKPGGAAQVELNLFGCVGGAFAGVEKSRAGWLELAHGSSLVLDDVGQLDVAIQRQILQAVRAGGFWPRGGTSLNALDVRLIGISRFDPAREADASRFDPGFAHWLGSIRVELPPLRERLEDLPMLAQAVLRREIASSHTNLEPSAYHVLLGHHWPGNLREFRSVLQRAALVARECSLSAEDLRPLLQPHADTPPPRASFSSEREWILDGLRRNRFRRAETAQFLRISRKTLYNKTQQYGLADSDRASARDARRTGLSKST